MAVNEATVKNIIANTQLSILGLPVVRYNEHSTADYYPGGMMMPGRNTEYSWSRMGAQGSIKDDEVYGKGNLINMGDRHLDTRILRTPKTDKKATKYPSISPYAYAACNPIIFNDPDGKVINVSRMTADQLSQYKSYVATLSGSSLFRYVQKWMEESTTEFYVDYNPQLKYGGQYNPNTNTVSLGTSISTYVLSQELFHAYQLENVDKLYNGTKPMSNIEIEGDLYSTYIANELSQSSPLLVWGEDLVNKYTLYGTIPSIEELKSEEYKKDFKEALNKRIEYYNNKVKDGLLEKDDVSTYTSTPQDFGPNSLIMVKEGADKLDDDDRELRVKAIEN